MRRKMLKIKIMAGLPFWVMEIKSVQGSKDKTTQRL